MNLEAVFTNHKLSATDAQRYEQCKQVLKDGMAVCLIVGAAAREIKDKQYYFADGHKTWEEFCRKEFGWTHRYLDKLILEAKAINSLPESMRKFITSHSAAAELAKIPETLRPVVVQSATASGTKPATAASIKKSSPPPKPKAQAKAPARAKPAATPAKKKDDGIKDETGLSVPQECLALWQRGNDAQELLTYISAIEMRVKKAQDEDDPLFTEVNFTDSIAKLRAVYVDLRLAKPYAICPQCNGKLASGCTLCTGRGFISQFMWQHIVSEETRALRAAGLAK